MAITKIKYQVTEVIIGSMFSMFISIIFVYMIFDSTESIPVYGTMGIIIDAIPQSLGVAFMSTFIPTLLVRIRISNGNINATEGRLTYLPNHAFTRSLLVSVLFCIVGVIVHFAAFSLLGIESMNFGSVLTLKASYGAILGAIVSFIVVSDLCWYQH